MDPEEEEQKKQEKGFLEKSKNELKRSRERAEKTKKTIKIFMKLPMPLKIILLVLILVPVVIVLIGGFLYVINYRNWDTARTAKAEALGSGTGYSSGIVTLNKDKGTWDISINDELKKKLTDAGVDINGMSQDELLKQLLILYGFDENDFSDKEIELMPYLLKAEIATQYVDLRTRDKMYDSATKEYKTLSDSEIEEASKNNQIVGTIHIKRVNTSDLDNPIVLEYIKYEDFKKNLETNDYDKVKGYFSINDEGNLVIATWGYNKTTYTLENGKIENPYKGTNTFQNSESYTLSEMVVDYKPLVSKYTLPFEVLTALLVNSEDTEFVEKVANLAFSANIEVTIAEEMTETKKTYVTNYYETIRNYQYIRMCAPVSGNRSIIEEYKFLSGDSSCDTSSDVIDDLSGFSGVTPPQDIHNCTYKDINFTNNQPSYTVKQDIVLKDNTYKYGITDADTWFMKAEKTVDKKVTRENLEQPASRVEDTYKYSETKSSKRANIPDYIKSSYLEEYYNNNKQRIEEIARQKTEQQANSQVATQPHPIVSIAPGNANTIKIEYNQQINQIIDGNGRRFYGTSTKNPSTGFTIITVSGITSSSLTLVDSGRNTFSYMKNASGVWEFKGSTPAIDVDYDQITIRYKRTDTESSIASGSIKTKYELVEGTPTQTIYDKKDEKFLKAYDESSKAKGNMASTPGWLEEMIDEYDPNFSTIIMYLLDSYYGRDTSEYDINSVLDIYGLESFKQFSGTSGAGFDQLKRYLHKWEGENPAKSLDGTQYKIVDDGAGHATVGYGVDIVNGGHEAEFKANGYDTNIGSFVPVDFVDKIEEKSIQNAIQQVETMTNGLNLKEYQKYALVSRAYNCGAAGAMGQRNGMTFKEAYNKYWKDTDDEYGVTPNNEMYNHSLYTQYMKDPQTSEGKYMLGLERRRKSEWILFKTGYFDVLNEYYVESNKYSIEGINLYNTDGTVNKTEISRLENQLTTKVNTRSGQYMDNGLQYKQCTWWAYSRASEYLGKAYPKQSNGTSGNGKDWYDINRKNGWFDYGSEPRANSIVCWNNPTAKGYGHVAYVEAVDTVNKKIYISHAGGGVSWYGIRELDWNGYFDSVYPIGYIYLDSPKNFK